MGSCSSRDLKTEESSKHDKNSKFFACYGQKGFTKSLRYNDSDVILFAYNGDIISLKSAMEKHEISRILSIRGFSQTLTLGESNFNSLQRDSSSNSLADEENKNTYKEK